MSDPLMPKYHRTQAEACRSLAVRWNVPEYNDLAKAHDALALGWDALLKAEAAAHANPNHPDAENWR